MTITKEQILKKHLEYGNPTSIQDHVDFEHYIFKEHILKAMDEYAKQESTKLLKALKTILDLIDRGVLVRDISKDNDFEYFTRQGIEITNAMITSLVLINEAIEKATL